MSEFAKALRESIGLRCTGHDDCEWCAEGATQQLTVIFRNFKRCWAQEERYPYLRTSGTRLHTRGCTMIDGYIKRFREDGDPFMLPDFVTQEQAMTPRRPKWAACKWCRPDVDPPERPLLLPRPKRRRDELASWLAQQERPTSPEGWRDMADAIMRQLSGRRPVA